MLIIFSCACWPSVCLWRNVYFSLLPIFWFHYLGVFWWWVIWDVCNILDIKPLLVASFAATFCHSFRLLFFFLFWCFLLLCKSLHLWLGPICLFLLLFLLPWKTDLRKHCYDICPSIFAYVLFYEFYGLVGYI